MTETKICNEIFYGSLCETKSRKDSLYEVDIILGHVSFPKKIFLDIFTSIVSGKTKFQNTRKKKKIIF